MEILHLPLIGSSFFLINKLIRKYSFDHFLFLFTQFQLATFFMLGAIALALLTIFFLVCLLFMKSTRVFHLCGWMQIISGMCGDLSPTISLCLQ